MSYIESKMVQKDILDFSLLNKNHDELVMSLHINTHSAIPPLTFPREAKKMAEENMPIFDGLSWNLNPNAKNSWSG